MVSSLGRFLWYELITTDTESAKTFYAEVMGWGVEEVSTPSTTYSVFSVGDNSVSGLTELPKAAKDIGAKPYWIGYVRVDNVDAANDRVKRLGGTVYAPSTDIPNFGRFSVVADLQMATLGLLECSPSSQERHIDPDTLGHVRWHELLALDWSKAIAFYGELFSWQKAEANVGALGTYQRFSVGGETIGGMATKPHRVPVAFWLYYFSIGDVDAAVKRVKAGGGKILDGPVEVPDGSWIAHCADPQGAIFALVGKRNYKARVFLQSDASHEVFSWRKHS